MTRRQRAARFTKNMKPTEDEKNPPKLAEAGGAGFKHNSGIIDEEFHKDLRGRTGAQKYYEMSRNHPLIATGLRVVDLFARRVEYTVESSGDTPEHEAAKELIEESIEDLPNGMPGVISTAASSLTYGWAWMEKVFKICRGASDSEIFDSKFDDGKIRWRRIRGTAQRTLDRWDLDAHGRAKGLWQRAAPNYELKYVSKKKALHVRMFDSDGSPEGVSMLRPAYIPYHNQTTLEWIEGVVIYRNGAGFPDWQLPPDICEATEGPKKDLYDKYVSMAKKIATDEYACVVRPSSLLPDGNPSGYDFGLISASGRNIAETDTPIQRYRREIAVVMFNMFMLTGEKSGSYNLAETQFEMLALVIESVIDLGLHAMNEDAVPELCALNGIPREFAPTIERGKIVPADLAKLGAFLTAGFGSGALTPDEPTENAIRAEADLPQLDKETARIPDGAIPPGITDGFGI